MFLFTWLRKLFSWFRFPLWRSRLAKVLILGLDDTGKTTLIESILHDDEFRQVAKTVAVSIRTVRIGSFEMSTFDLGGHALARQSWKDYFVDVAGVVFMIDSANPARFREAAAELDGLLEDPALPNVPSLILANKVDVAGSVGFADIADAFHLNNVCYGETQDLGAGRPAHLFDETAIWSFGGVQVVGGPLLKSAINYHNLPVY
jgi:GTP-binding protein SAR1